MSQFGFEAGFFRDCMAEVDVRPERMLVIGCGEGIEPAHLSEATHALVIGIDLDVDPQLARPGVVLLRADAQHMPFRDGAFDAVYCYHVLEHVPDPASAIAEARRTLRSAGAGYFGTPNRTRLVGYIGGRGGRWDKLKWNIADWSMRLRGRWSNAKGAHAGFSSGELSRLLATSFADVTRVDLAYYVGKYPRIAGLWRFLFRFGIAGFLAPSVYFRTRRQVGATPGR